MVAFLDANVPIYAAGAPHPLREPCRLVMGAVAISPTSAVTSIEMLQELLHVFIRQGDDAKALRIVRGVNTALSGRIELVGLSDILAAASPGAISSLQARDRIHLAVMERLGITDIISTDRGFERVGGVRRLDPSKLAEWRDQIFPVSPLP